MWILSSKAKGSIFTFTHLGINGIQVPRQPIIVERKLPKKNKKKKKNSFHYHNGINYTPYYVDNS